MRRYAGAILAAALTAAGSIAISATADAGIAARQVPVRSFVQQLQYNFDGIGSQKGWYHHWAETFKAQIAPRLAWYDSFTSVTVPAPGGPVESSRSIEDMVDGRLYDKTDGYRWTVHALSPAQIKSDTAIASPYWKIGTLYAIPGIALVGPRHYHVTCSLTQIKNFWVSYIGFGYSQLAGGHDVKTVTLDFWFDSAGRPATIIVTGQGSLYRMSYRITYRQYNGPVVVHRPV